MEKTKDEVFQPIPEELEGDKAKEMWKDKVCRHCGQVVKDGEDEFHRNKLCINFHPEDRK